MTDGVSPHKSDSHDPRGTHIVIAAALSADRIRSGNLTVSDNGHTVIILIIARAFIRDTAFFKVGGGRLLEV